nr:MAG TPA: major tail protein [Caudoviricetes sp.]
MPTKLLRPNVGIYVATSDAFANWAAPTLTEITSATKVFNISPAVTDDYTLNMTDSDSDSSLAIVDNASVETPTYYNYEASLDGFVDENLTATSVYNKFRDLFSAPDVKYYLIKRVGYAHDAAFAAGQLISVYGVKTDFPVDIVGDGEMIRLGARFLTTGEVAVNVAVGAGTAGVGPELRATVGTKSTSNGKIKVWWVPIANVTGTEDDWVDAPSVADITDSGSVDLTSAIAWDSYELGSTDSNKIDDRGIIDTGAVQERGFAQFAGSLMFFRGITSETTGAYYEAFEAFKAATDGTRPVGFLVTRINVPNTTPLAATQKVSVYKFIADAFQDNTEGEDSVKFMVNFAPQGKLGVRVAAAA